MIICFKCVLPVDLVWNMLYRFWCLWCEPRPLMMVWTHWRKLWSWYLQHLSSSWCLCSPAHRAWPGPSPCSCYSWNPHEHLRSCALSILGYVKAQKWNRWTVYLLLSYWQEASIQSLIGIMWWDEKTHCYIHAWNHTSMLPQTACLAE